MAKNQENEESNRFIDQRERDHGRLFGWLIRKPEYFAFKQLANVFISLCLKGKGFDRNAEPGLAQVSRGVLVDHEKGCQDDVQVS